MLDIKAETFLCACRHMNYTHAARELHLTQSAVSQQIHALEQYYGVPLFCYAGRTLTLTPQGEYLRDRLQAMGHDTRRIREAMGQQGQLRRIHIGATMSAGEFLLPECFARFMKAHPQIQLSVTRLDTQQILRLVDEGTVDFAFVEGFVPKDRYGVRQVKEEQIIAVCAGDYPLPPLKALPELFCHPLLVREEGSGTREIFTEFLRSQGYGIDSFDSFSQFNSPTLIKELLLRGCGISVLYRTVVADALASGRLRQIQVPGMSLRHEYNAVWRRESLYQGDYQALIQQLVP